MSDRPDLIQSELAGLAFDALQQCFRPGDIDAIMSSEPPPFVWAQKLYMVIDPAAGGPQSDFAFVTFYRHKGLFVVRLAAIVFHLELPLKHIEAHGLVHQKAGHQVVAQALQEANGLQDGASVRVAGVHQSHQVHRTLYGQIGCSPAPF